MNVFLFYSFIFLFFIVLIVLDYRNLDNQKIKNTPPLNEKQYQREFKEILMIVAAKSMLADEKATKIELENVKKYFIKYFGKNAYKNSFQQLQNELKLDRNIDEVYTRINNGFDYFSKIQMLHLVIGIISADERIFNNEYDFLKDFIKKVKINQKTFESILGMYSFSRKTFDKKEEKKKAPPKQPQKQKYNPYIILEIDNNSSKTEIKKAYRKLANIHHPDKVNHLGEEFLKHAHEKFKKIKEAYETIKKERGIK